MLEFFEEVRERIYKRTPVHVVYLDFAKVVDKGLPKKKQVGLERMMVGIGDKHSSWT